MTQALRSEAHQQQRAAAALFLQKVWRGRAVRHGTLLAGLLGERAARLRAEALASAQAAQVCVCVHVCMFVCMYVCTCACACAYVSVFVLMCVYACVQ
jgi:hypothetical protein